MEAGLGLVRVSNCRLQAHDALAKRNCDAVKVRKERMLIGIASESRHATGITWIHNAPLHVSELSDTPPRRLPLRRRRGEMKRRYISTRSRDD